MRTAIVTDSTCDWSEAEYAASDVTVVPLYLHWGDECTPDVCGNPAAIDAFYDRMAREADLPTSSQPAPADFIAVYDSLAAEGFEHVVSIHLSSKLSGTVQSAQIAAAQAAIPVDVVDSANVTASLGLVVAAAVSVRDAGVSGDALTAEVERACGQARLFGVPDSLDNLVRGGRATAAQGFATGLLNIKVLLHLADGTVEPMGKVRGSAAAITRLVDVVSQRCGEAGPQRVRIFHTRNQRAADALQAAIGEAGLPVSMMPMGMCGSVIGTHLGEGAIGICVLPEHCFA